MCMILTLRFFYTSKRKKHVYKFDFSIRIHKAYVENWIKIIYAYIGGTSHDIISKKF